MEIKQLLILIRKWFWLIVLGVMFGAVMGGVISLVQEPVYQAATKILITRNRQDTNSDFAYLPDNQLVQTYIELFTTRPIIEAASERVGFKINRKEMVTVAKVGETQIIQLTVESHDPKLAMQIANTLVDVLIEQNEKLQADRYLAIEDSLSLQIKKVEDQMNSLSVEFDQITSKEIQEQLAQVDEQIKDTETQISDLQTDIAKTTSNVELTEKQARLSQLISLLQSYQQIRSNLIFLGTPSQVGTPREDSRLLKLQSTLNLYQQLYLNLLNNLESLRLVRLQYTPNVAQIEKAIIPDSPVRPNKVINMILGCLIGVIFATGGAILIEFFDDSLKSPSDIDSELGLPTLGVIPQYPRLAKNKLGTFITQHPKSPVSEAFRLLRANLSLRAGDKPLKTLLILSPDKKNGKTSVALNLAASLSLLGRKVMLVDANIRSPHLHASLGIENTVGLGDILSSELDVTKATRTLSELKTVTAITGGSLLDSPTETLESDRLSMVLRKLSEKTEILILDGPALASSDALAFASRADGVLLVIRPGHTRVAEARAAVEQLRYTGTCILGVVFNDVPRNWHKYYDGFYFAPESEGKKLF